jgi:hypothetical protein
VDEAAKIGVILDIGSKAHPFHDVPRIDRYGG